MVEQVWSCSMRDLKPRARRVGGVCGHELVSRVDDCFGGEDDHDCSSNFKAPVRAPVDELAEVAN
jgi:hypothetical protein